MVPTGLAGGRDRCVWGLGMLVALLSGALRIDEVGRREVEAFPLGCPENIRLLTSGDIPTFLPTLNGRGMLVAQGAR